MFLGYLHYIDYMYTIFPKYSVNHICILTDVKKGSLLIQLYPILDLLVLYLLVLKIAN